MQKHFQNQNDTPIIIAFVEISEKNAKIIVLKHNMIIMIKGCVLEWTNDHIAHNRIANFFVFSNSIINNNSAHLGIIIVHTCDGIGSETQTRVAL